MRKTWNIEEFNKVNLPEVVSAIEIPTIEQFLNPIRVLDLPIKMKGSSELRIPHEIEPFRKIIGSAINYELINFSNFNEYTEDYYVYVTIDQKVVKSGNTGRRPGAHSDAFITKDGEQLDVKSETAHLVDEVSHTYIAYDCLPTEFFNAKFPIKTTNCFDSMKTFDEIADSAEVVTYPTHTLLMMDPYVVHRSAVSDVETPRTFVKVSISKKKYAREGNTKNPLFDYDWKFKPRDGIRNHPW